MSNVRTKVEASRERKASERLLRLRKDRMLVFGVFGAVEPVQLRVHDQSHTSFWEIPRERGPHMLIQCTRTLLLTEVCVYVWL